MRSKPALPVFLLYLPLFFNIQLYAQTAKSIPAQNLILPSATYLKTQDKLYTAIGDQYLNDNSNRILVLDPAWGTIEKTIEVGYNPQFLCKSFDDQFLYFTTDGPHSIKRLRSANHVVDGSVLVPDNRRVTKMVPVPGHAQRLLVASLNERRDSIFIELLEDNQFKSAKIATGANSFAEYIIDFGIANDSTMILWATGYIQKYRINSAGIKLLQTIPGANFDFGDKGFVTPTRVVTHRGKVVNFSEAQLITEPSINANIFALSSDEDSEFFYTMTHLGGGFTNRKLQFSRYNKSDIRKEVTWEDDFEVSSSSHSATYGLHSTGKDRLMFTFQGFTHIAWNCTAAIAPPLIAQGAQVKACPNTPSPIELSVDNTVAPEVIWSNGKYGDTLQIEEEGSFAAKYTDSKGCQTAFSASTQVSFFLPADVYQVSTEQGSGFNFTICKNAKINLKGIAVYDNAKKWIWSTGDTLQTLPVSGGTYRVKIISTDGCEGDWSAAIVVNERADAAPDRPIIQLLNPDNEICNGETALFESTKGYKYYWWSVNPNNSYQNSISHTSNLNYTISVTLRVANSEACYSDPSLPLQLRLYAAPPKPSISIQGSQIISSNTTAIHQWYLNDVLLEGKTGSSIPTQGGGFYAAKTFDGRCNSDFSNLLAVGGKVTSTQEAAHLKVSLYPNPTQDVLYIEWPPSIQPQHKSIQVYSLDGKLQPINVLPNSGLQRTVIHTDHLHKGIYWAEIQMGAERFRYKFVKL